MLDITDEDGDIVKKFEGLSEQQKQAVIWLMENQNVIDRLLDSKRLTWEEMDFYKTALLEKKEYYMFILMYQKYEKDKKSLDTGENLS